ncbi:MAG: ABC transporter permease [Opitutae bacterium]|nr:ABC transporter permease [Opitutae bacterium]
MTEEQGQSPSTRMNCEVGDGVLHCRFSGRWTIDTHEREGFHRSWRRALAKEKEVRKVSFEIATNVEWDSVLVVFIRSCLRDCKESKLSVDMSRLPSGLRKLFLMAEGKGIDKVESDGGEPGFFTAVGELVFAVAQAIFSSLHFLGEWTLSLFRLFRLKARFRASDFIESCRACGASALPIVTLVSFLTGLTMAFVGSVQLAKFNARIYVADLVSLAMVREMGGLMVAIVMAGRTGAAFAAELGNMKLNEEIDSLRTFGISPMDFLILPRTLALFVMIPMLTLYADVVGMLGGMVVGMFVMDFSLHHYIEQTQTALNSMWDIYSGLAKTIVFGGIIGMVGCNKGLNCGNDSAALGEAVTSAVVTSITLVVVADALFEVFYSIMGWR